MRNKKTSQQAGKQFENEVAEMLALANFDVRRESVVGYKKVDLYIEERRLGSLRRIAVECKNYSEPLSQAKVSEIYSNYRPLYDGNFIDEILIVTAAGLAPSALTMVKNSRGLAHMTSAEIFDLVMDFGSYSYSLQRQFEEDGLFSYYIPPLTSGGEDLESKILDWVSAPDSPPLAILGSYGTGKTTLAKRITSLLALRAREDRHQRIPILVKLGEISTEQSLEGLLGKLFTAHPAVRNYSFDLFMSLNLQGRFVIFLDGFDEMNHSLSRDDMRYNFRQLNRLVSGKSKAVLLGRPTAFLNDDEYHYAFRGVREVGGAEMRELGWPEYKEIILLPFSDDQAREFLRKYLTYLLGNASKEEDKARLKRALDEQVDSLFGKDFSDLVRRPVQLKMLAEILPSWQGRISDLTVSKLYSYFIDVIIEREQEKLGRRHFDVVTRRAFARDLAMFLWLNRSELSITADRIPSTLIAKYASPGDDLETVKRDLIAACFLDRKLGDSLFFPHRSFQEFLVAEMIIEELNRGLMSLLDASEIANEEVVDFIKDMVDDDTIKRWSMALEEQRGIMSRNFAEIWIFRTELVDFLWGRFQQVNSPWHIALLVLAARAGILGGERSRNLVAMAVERIKGAAGRYALVCFWCVLLLGEEREILRALTRLTKIQVYSEARASRRLFMPEYSIVQFFSAILPDKEGRIKIWKGYEMLLAMLDGFCLIGDKAGGKVVAEGKLNKKIEFMIKGVPEVSEYQKKYCDPKWFNANWERRGMKGEGDEDNKLINKLRREKREGSAWERRSMKGESDEANKLTDKLRREKRGGSMPERPPGRWTRSGE